MLADEDGDLRVAHVLAGEGLEVSIHGSAKSSRYPKADNADGVDVVVGYTAAALEIAEKAGVAAVTAADVDSSPVPTVAGASLLGVALAIAARLEASGSDVLRVAIAHPELPSIRRSPDILLLSQLYQYDITTRSRTKTRDRP